MKTKLSAFLALATLTLLAACIPARSSPRDFPQTLTPMSEALRATITARAIEAASGGDDLATAVFNATQQSENIYATQTARAALYEPARLATATAIAPVIAELPLYHVDPSDGYVAWLHNPVTIELTGGEQGDFASDYPLITAADFVVVSDVTWNTFNGVGGCGFLFRSDGDTDKPTQYVVSMERVAPGHIVFGATFEGELSNYHEAFPRDNDKTFDWQNDATNRLALVVRGNLIDIYTNGTFVGQVDITDGPPPAASSPAEEQPVPGMTEEQIAQLEDQAAQNDQTMQEANSRIAEAQQNFVENQPFFYDGFISFLATLDTGTATCKFENAWLFIIEK